MLEQVSEKEEVKLPEEFLVKWLLFSNQNIQSEEQAKQILESEKNQLKYQIIEGKLMSENEISHTIIGCAIEVHKQIGPGLLESAYQECLYYELVNEGLKVEKEKALPIVYKEVKLDHGYRIDLLVENKVVIDQMVDALNSRV